MKCQPVNVIVLLNDCQHNIFDTMKLKDLLILNCESPKYIAKLFSLIMQGGRRLGVKEPEVNI